MRFNAIIKGGKCEFRSRNGKLIDIPSNLFPLPFIAMANHYKDDIVFDGELLVVDEGGKPLDRKTGNGILNKAVKGTMSEKEAESVRATLWDAVPAESFWKGVDTEPYHVRFAKLYNSMMDMTHSQLHVAHLVNMVEHHDVADIHAARVLFTKALERGQEGIMLKARQGIWENKRAKHQIKFKAELECDLLCVGWEEGTGKNVGRLGALQLETSCGMLKVGVGSGFSDKDRDEIGRDTVGKIIAVKYNAIVDDKSKDTKSLFLPIFLEVRLDKTKADSLAKLESQ
jgi:ATP-dependent DNA ligase